MDVRTPHLQHLSNQQSQFAVPQHGHSYTSQAPQLLLNFTSRRDRFAEHRLFIGKSGRNL